MEDSLLSTAGRIRKTRGECNQFLTPCNPGRLEWNAIEWIAKRAAARRWGIGSPLHHLVYTLLSMGRCLIPRISIAHRHTAGFRLTLGQVTDLIVNIS